MEDKWDRLAVLFTPTATSSLSSSSGTRNFMVLKVRWTTCIQESGILHLV